MIQDAKVLENGLKTIRLIGTHGMNVELVSNLAKTWALKVFMLSYIVLLMYHYCIIIVVL